MRTNFPVDACHWAGKAPSWCLFVIFELSLAFATGFAFLMKVKCWTPHALPSVQCEPVECSFYRSIENHRIEYSERFAFNSGVQSRSWITFAPPENMTGTTRDTFSACLISHMLNRSCKIHIYHRIRIRFGCFWTVSQQRRSTCHIDNQKFIFLVPQCHVPSSITSIGWARPSRGVHLTKFAYVIFGFRHRHRSSACTIRRTNNNLSNHSIRSSPALCRPSIFRFGPWRIW